MFKFLIPSIDLYTEAKQFTPGFWCRVQSFTSLFTALNTNVSLNFYTRHECCSEEFVFFQCFEA